MLNALIGSTGSLLYVVTTIMVGRRLLDGQNVTGSRWGSITALLAGSGATLQGYLLSQTVIIDSGLNFGFFNVLSLVSWLMVILLLLSMLAGRRENLGIVVFPLAALCLLLSMAFYNDRHVLSHYSPGLSTHIALAILAYSLLAIAALQALLLAYQDYHLHSRHPGRIMGAMPPLQTMENLLFQVIALGVLVLSLAIVSGMVFLEDMFAQHVAHKTILSIAAWLIFVTLLWGRWRFGWRGRIAIRWSLIGFMFLMLAFFGTKVVFEFVLNRT